MDSAASVSEAQNASKQGHDGKDEIVKTRTGEEFLLRMTSPDDEPAVVELLEHVAKEDLRYRFFVAIKCFDAAFVSRLLRRENERAASVIAIDVARGNAAGLACAHQENDAARAEFAVLVRSDLKGHGLGWRLMEHLIAWTRTKDYVALDGIVLRENSAMLEFCRSLGCRLAAMPEDPLLTVATLSLRDGQRIEH